MIPKPVVPRARANRDVEAAVAWYLAEAGKETALRFIAALEKAYAHIARHPASASPRHAHELGLTGLRSWPLRRFPFVVFFVEQSDVIDVWRVLHGERDIPRWMQDEGEAGPE